ncbi:MAG TPA: TatD family deoxyribonuclease [Desulfobacteraceae bacterium]|nr:TatD family hydrolase [Deltaproteobacteria bacterium]MBW2355985.1 TatD family hydrolase [Deltaproteobacteria bacterium]RLB99062.1 MAG: TatD family deoxyribonuclease [Deltaproteobacteria bacterium]HDI60225.1 TatD family deoxyribonuclease [Desulfobacteraceae bacterium]
MTALRLYDVHCHLQDTRLANDLPAVLARAAEAGVARMMCCGTAPEDWPTVLDLAARYPRVRPSLGLHPWYLERRTADWRERLEALVAANRCGVGEIGLDHHLPADTRPLQLAAFRFQVALANRYGRPASIHCRRAWRPLLEELKAQGGLSAGGLVHAYGGGPDIVAALARRNVSVSFGGGITRPNARRPVEACRAVAADRLLVETDSPDILPSGCPGPHNEPACLAEVIRAVATARGLEINEAANLTWDNARRLFAGLESSEERG